MSSKSKSGKKKASGVAKKSNGNGSGKKDAAVQTPQMPATMTLVRKNTVSGEVSGRPRGRPAPGYENGYMEDGKFIAGNPKGMKKKGRPSGSKSILKSIFGPSGKLRGKRAASGSSLNDIETIVANVVADRLKTAKEAAFKSLQKANEDAFKAFSEALGV